jgi:hypothetical protein
VTEPAGRHMEGTWHAVYDDDVLVRPSDQARNTRMFLVEPSLLLRLMASWLINEFRQHLFLYARAGILISMGTTPMNELGRSTDGYMYPSFHTHMYVVESCPVSQLTVTRPLF